jgi:hypothetical protein
VDEDFQIPKYPYLYPLKVARVIGVLAWRLV